MTSNYFRLYITGYTVANFSRYPIRRRVTKSRALEFMFVILAYFFLSGLMEIGNQTDLEKLYSIIAKRYKSGMRDMAGRAPGEYMA